MAKTKLTLYMPEQVSKIAHKRAKLSGKSVSTMVKNFFLKEEKKATSAEISPNVQKWVGVLESEESYQQMREEIVSEKLKKYEDIS